MDRKTVIAHRYATTARRLSMLLLTTAVMVPLTTACRVRENEQSRSVVVNAPADGIVRRVVVESNVPVDKDAAMIEIAVQLAPNPTSVAAAQAQYVSAQTELTSAEGEANRIAADLQRIEPLVKRGLASQAELDKARSQSLDARERLRLAHERANSAEATRNRATSPGANEEILVVRAPAAGTVQAVSVQAGQSVVTGQALATLVEKS